MGLLVITQDRRAVTNLEGQDKGVKSRNCSEGMYTFFSLPARLIQTSQFYGSVLVCLSELRPLTFLSAIEIILGLVDLSVFLTFLAPSLCSSS